MNEETTTIILQDQDASKSVSLCSSCESILIDLCEPHDGALLGYTYDEDADDPLRYNYESHLYDAYGDWLQGMHEGCWICCRLRDYIPAPILKDLGDGKFTRDAVTFSATVIGGIRKPFSLLIKVRNYQMGLAVRPADPVVLEIGESTNSSSSWKTVLKWLDDCTCRHVFCAHDNIWYPTRLLDLGDATNEHANIKVIESANEKPKGSYMTLSHCWGEGKHLLLTTQNTLSLQSEIPELPRTFAESVSVCRNLGIRYLWIDSLCIVQDDPEDWAREAALMQYVYTHAWCNISATASQHSNEGLFRERKGYTISQLAINLKGVGSVIIIEEDPVAQIEGSPLQRIFWECCHASACETFHKGFPRKGRDSGMRNTLGVGSSRISVGDWSSIVQNYTRRSITYNSDRLPALSGLVKSLSPVLRGSYLAGLWSNENLIYDLAWANVASKSDLRPRPKYRAPSWSWASIDDPVKFMRFPGSQCTPHSTVIDVCVTPANTDETLAVKNGFLILRGHLKLFDVDKEKPPKRFDLNFDTCDDTPRQFFLLLLYMEIEALTDEDEDDPMIAGYGRLLILLAHPDHPTWYRRVGLANARCFVFRGIPNWDLDDFNAGAEVPCEEYLGSGKDEGHIIRIV
ncbi:hypothetical protein ACMFMG_003770 [Clarireedia jacksonii]